MAGAKNDLRDEQQREKREESREKKEERREGIEASQDHDGKEKREERREKSEERRERREDTREKTEDRPQEAARGPQMRPPEGGQPFSWPCRPVVGPLAASRAEGGEQRKERRDKREHVFFFENACFP